MNEIRRYEVRGTAAMASREELPERGAIIDYDIARRSYEARQRLARRQASSGKPAARGMQSRGTVSRMSALDAARASYTPGSSMFGTLGDIVRNIGFAISQHPFLEQLRHGSDAGFETGKATYRQVFTSATVCMAVSAAIMFVGI